MIMGQAGDADLVRRARRGSRDAAGVLFERHWPGAWRAARVITGSRAMADDVAQDAFERAFAALGRFDERRPFAAWLHRIVVNRSLDLLRRERRLVGLDAPDRVEAEWRDLHAEDRDLLERVSRLGPQRRVVVVLRYGLGYAPNEIAEMLGVPNGTVNSRLARALKELREQQLEEADVEGA
jgi:RNA polymerase sigma-70 factor (ECF subfamily)